MNVPLIGVVTAAVTWLLTAGLMIRKSWRIGYLEGRLAAWEERWREHQSLFHGPLSSGPTSMAMPFSVASRAEIFGDPDPGAEQRLASEVVPEPYIDQRPVGDGWNNYGSATGPAGEWAARDQRRRDEWARRDRNR